MTTSEVLLGLVLILPLASFVLSLIIPERYSWLVSLVASAFLLVSASLSATLFFSAENIFIRFDWFQMGSRAIDFSLQLDALSRVMILAVTTVSFLVHVYSIGYMAGEPGIKRYFAMLGFFTFAMLGIVMAGNLILIFVFWELVGFSSYLLIGHWMEKPQASKAAYKAFLYNRIGDAALLIGILIVWLNTGTLSITNDFITPQYSTVGGILIFCGVIAKSAQLPLFSWLPDAMEGPTPVSALLHAATMVAAGIFLLIRFFPFFTDTALVVIAITGAITAVFAAVCALNQFDIKKILAYSTISQLGLMVTAIGVGAKDAALLHLFTHAFFKAGLFLAAGSVIHVLHHYQQQTKEHFDVQDIRNLGGLRKKLPFTFIIFCITGASLAGVPLFSGFLSKDAILTAMVLKPAAIAFDSGIFSFEWILAAIILITSFITVLYTFRMIWFIFFGREQRTISLRESPWVMRAPMAILAIASYWFIVSLNPFEPNGWFSIPYASGITITSATIVLIALVISGYIYPKRTVPKTHSFIQHGFGIDSFYQKTIGPALLKFSTLTQTIDRKWIDGFLHITAYGSVALAHGVAWFDRNIIDGIVNLGARIAGLLGSFTRSFQGGKIQLYIFWAVTGLIIFLFFALI